MQRILNIVCTTIFLCLAAWLWVTWYSVQAVQLDQCAADLEACRVAYYASIEK